MKLVRVLAAACTLLASITLSSQSSTRNVTVVKFTPTSAVVQEDTTLWRISVEALVPPPNPGDAVTVANMSFHLPPNGTIKRFQGTFGMMAPFGNTGYVSCTQPNAALAVLFVDNKQIPMAVHFDSGGHRDRDIFFNFDIPVKYSNGNARIHVEANPLGCWSDVEIQGLLQVAP